MNLTDISTSMFLLRYCRVLATSKVEIHVPSCISVYVSLNTAYDISFYVVYATAYLWKHILVEVNSTEVVATLKLDIILPPCIAV